MQSLSKLIPCIALLWSLTAHFYRSFHSLSVVKCNMTAISQFFILSPRGDCIISKDYRGDETHSMHEDFFRQVLCHSLIHIWKYGNVDVFPEWRPCLTSCCSKWYRWSFGTREMPLQSSIWMELIIFSSGRIVYWLHAPRGKTMCFITSLLTWTIWLYLHYRLL